VTFSQLKNLTGFFSLLFMSVYNFFLKSWVLSLAPSFSFSKKKKKKKKRLIFLNLLQASLLDRAAEEISPFQASRRSAALGRW
jgi:hypothetical protein